MFAVIKTGGKQYKVAANDILKIEKLASEAGDVVTFDQVLMVGNGDDVTVGAPLVAGALVAGQLLETSKSDTVIIFKKRRRHNSRRRNGHRQLLSTVRITEILIGGAVVTTLPDARIKDRLAAAQATAASVSEAAPAAKATRQAASKAETAPAAAGEAPKAKADGDFIDDIKLIGGVGAALEKKLIAAGVASLKDIAAWTEADLAKFDEELALHGRAARDEWVQQAQDLIAGKPPRAKVDQELAAEEKAAKKPAAKKAAPKADQE
ncbi:MAG: 50S ribosomal protein L21 [Devosia sp.]|nr:50S ribosomal protein L21 [Devosia sp.]